ncbi:F-box protein 9 [Geosmithia morbida]|uniref:F-box protein 9 n=1 Tax=Geosmithia morbida TaxID=1094350 RepID=A0A9P5D6L9_9HYPO|nr:F-box protein 9 [Geosmithia morbida]KAF4124895.1 F-box protein 9 [Geosmithia morbida]
MSQDQQLDSELDSFRRQWLSEVRGRNEPPPDARSAGQQEQHQQHRQHQQPTTRKPAPAPPVPSSSGTRPACTSVDDRACDDVHVQSLSFDEPPPRPPGPTIGRGGDDEASRELVSALDHFEEAMEREAQGNMGESLKLYRRAYKLDNGVDRRYREKHFPASRLKTSKPAPAAPPPQPSGSEPSRSEPSRAGGDVEEKRGGAVKAAEDQPPPPPPPAPIADLLQTFSGLSIEPVPPEVEGMPQPPCPISDLPEELLVHVMRDVAVADVADFARLSLVCRRMAYLVSTEQQIWRRVSEGDEFGFAAMHHRYAVGIDWKDMSAEDEGEGEDEDGGRNGAPTMILDGDGTVLTSREMRSRLAARSAEVTRSLVPSPSYPDWRSLFRSRPRIRFNGCYISTVNYVRSGALSTNQATWGGSPIHIVTYYRYLRFFRDGSAISLLTTDEPRDVVHHLTKEEVELVRDRKHHHLHHHHGHGHGHGQQSQETSAPAALPTPVMSLALKGRWRISPSRDLSVQGGVEEDEEEEGNVYVETEGVGPKYMYRMDLSLRSAGKAAARNNKVVWRGFYSYNKLTDDWAEFGLKNDRPFFFSRVKSYGH